MSYVDQDPLNGGLDNEITEWVLGDSREFLRQNKNALDANDVLSSAYFTIKQNPLTLDVNALLQTGITTTSQPWGVISGNNIAFVIFGSQLAAAVVGPVWYYDIVLITQQGKRFTFETGTINFVQGITQAQAGGSPPVFPNGGVPNFKGFASGPPTANYNPGIYNVGDIWFTNQPTGPDGWRCIAPGNPGAWQPLT